MFADAYNWAGQHLEELFRPRLGPCRLFSKSSESAAVNHHCGRHAGVACNKKRTVLCLCTLRRILALVGSNMTGTIPTSISRLASLSWFQLSGNQLTGLPPAFTCQQQSNLVFLDVSSNRLSGSLPTWACLSKLTYVAFIGSFDSEWGSGDSETS